MGDALSMVDEVAEGVEWEVDPNSAAVGGGGFMMPNEHSAKASGDGCYGLVIPVGRCFVGSSRVWLEVARLKNRSRERSFGREWLGSDRMFRLSRGIPVCQMLVYE